MGCDIHSYVEQQTEPGNWVRVPWTSAFEDDEGPFGWRCYGVFGWLADVRNYSAVPPIAHMRGLPADVSAGVAHEYGHEVSGMDAHSASHLTVDELVAFDYDASFEDRRVTRGGNGGVTAEPGGGTVVTFREFLGGAFARDLGELARLNEQRPTRIVFWFDC